MEKKEWKFKYIGTEDKKDYFCIIIEDNGDEKSVLSRYYMRRWGDNGLFPLGSFFVPKFRFEPNYKDAYEVMKKIANYYYGWFPKNIKIANRVY